MWTFEYTLAQIFVFIAMVLLVITFFLKNKIIILILSGVSCFLYALQYLLLGAYTGMALDLIATIRAVWFFINEKKSRQKEPISLIVIFAIIIIFGIITFNSLFDLLIIIATLIYTYSLWQSNVLIYRYLALVNGVLWLAYNIFYNTVFGIVSDFVILIAEITGIITYYVCQKKEKLLLNTNIVENKK